MADEKDREDERPKASDTAETQDEGGTAQPVEPPPTDPGGGVLEGGRGSGGKP
jgi:hypothetical protein